MVKISSNVKVRSRDFWNSEFEFPLKSRSTNPKSRRPCLQGDSGGPLFLVKEGRAVQEGIISLGEGCGDERFPAIYISVRKFLDWIVLNTDGEEIWSSDCTKLNSEKFKHQTSLIHHEIKKKVTKFLHDKTTSEAYFLTNFLTKFLSKFLTNSFSFTHCEL